MSMPVDSRGQIVVVAPGVSRLDAQKAGSLRSAMDEALKEGSRLVLDLEGVTALDSTCLGVLVGTLRRLPADGEMRLCGLSENVSRLLHMTRLDRALKVYPTCREAIAADC